MLKSIVNGAEHDIISIPMKGKNLYDINAKDINNGYVNNAHLNQDGTTVTYTPSEVTEYIELTPNASYILSNIGSYNSLSYCIYDSNKQYITGEKYSGQTVKSINVPFNGKYLRFSHVKSITKTMLNLGSTALPYEPYGYQNGWEVRDNQNRIIWGREDELQTITGTLPFKGYDLPVKVKSLLGNSAQNGTPTPDSPIIPEMCGVRTENLVNESKATLNAYISSTDGVIGSSTVSNITDYIDINASPFVISGVRTTDLMNTGNRGICFFNANKEFIGGVSYSPDVMSNPFFASHPSSDAKYIRFTFDKAFENGIMLNIGSTALPYEPYGWKIPLTNAGQTTPIYLGEVPTIRRIKKLVFDGTEDWSFASSDSNRTVCKMSLPGRFIAGYCTHINWKKQGTYEEQEYNRIVYDEYLYVSLENSLLDEQTVVAFKSYFAQQYQNGTPVTIWYVLSEPETGIVNEPLAKIGDYADELTTIKVHGLSAPLYGIGDYKDILNLSTGVVTRNIKKLVLTGTNADGNSNITPQGIIYITPSQTLKSVGDAYCTHFRYVNQGQGANMPINSVTTSGGAGTSFWFKTEYTNVADFKSYLAAQYAAGTPVTVWYVLATPKTETITVPTGMTGEIEGYLTQISTPTPTSRSVPKWNGKEETDGTYEVTVYDLPEIETTTGKNTLTVDTTLAPYDVTINGHIKYTYWGKIREDVRSGLAQTKFPVGTILYDNNDETTGRAFQVVGYDKHFDPSLTARGYTHSMTLCQLKLSGQWQFDATEAFLYTTVEMQPGTYKFKIPNYDTAYGGNKTYYFTSTASVPVDSQITLSWAYQQPPKTVTAYAGPNPQTKTTAITGFNALPLSEWIEGESPEAVDLGTIKLANNDPDSAYGKLNHIHRTRYGSNNYYQSGLRQLLNTDLASNNWWHPTTIFDRPYANRTTNGYLRSLNEDFINVLATPEITHIANNIFEYPSLDGRTFTLNTEYKINTDKVFLLSHTEVNLSSSPNVGSVLDYYSTHNTNADRVKYRLDNGTAYYWWLRTPYPSNTHTFRRCLTSGALYDSGASSYLGVAPAYIIQ